MPKSEPELYRDKIEISLDGRQVFYLFFGGAVIACLVFVLGVMVGKRVEARAHVDRAATSAARDPLAALDALDASSRGAASLRPGAGSGRAVAGSDRAAVADLASAQRAAGAAARAQPAARPDEAADEAAGPAPAAKPEPAARPAPKPEHAVAPKPAPAAKPEPAAAANAPAGEPAAHPEPGKQKPKFTLQLSSFQDRHEADSFLDTVRTAGYHAYLVEADVDGKGTWYRVRLGAYASYDDALAAKSDFEAKVRKIAYVTRVN
jgi:DedD protein